MIELFFADQQNSFQDVLFMHLLYLCWKSNVFCEDEVILPTLWVLFVTVGSTLIKVGDCQRRLGGAEREFLQTSSISFLTPLRNFLEGDWRTISVSVTDSLVLTDLSMMLIYWKMSSSSQRERRLLENRRLDLDASKARLKKAKAAEAKAAVRFISPVLSFFFSRDWNHKGFSISYFGSHLSFLKGIVQPRMKMY